MRAGISADLRGADGEPIFGRDALHILDKAGIAWDWLKPLEHIGPDEVAAYDALYINTPRFGSSALAAGAGRLKVIARHGVGYDSVDIAACDAAGIVVTIQPEGVRRPLAVAALTLILALSQRLVIKDRLTRDGCWEDRAAHMGTGLIGRRLGIVGAGNVGRELLRLVEPFGMQPLICDPHLTRPPIGAELLPLHALLAASDFVVLLLPLVPSTYHLIDAMALACMKPSAFLINVARGAVVDESALVAALTAGKIAGAALDVFEKEPVATSNPLLAMANVIVTPHALCWTDQCFAGIAASGMQSVCEVLAGTRPCNAVSLASGGLRAEV